MELLSRRSLLAMDLAAFPSPHQTTSTMTMIGKGVGLE